MDDGGRAMEGPPAADAALASAALPSGLCWRTDPDRRLAALVVRDARAAMHAARLHRRCDEPADASAVCGDGVDVRLFRGDADLSGAVRQADRVLLRQACRVSGEQERRGRRRWNDAVWARVSCGEHRDHLCQLLAGQGPSGALQDRLVKEMRLRGINTVAAGNAFLPTFMADYNARFAKPPFDERDLHRPLAGDDDLDDAFAWKEDRTVSKNLTLQYDQVLFILEPNEITRSLACKRVMVLDYPDGRFAMRHNGVDLPYRTFDKRPQVNQAAIVENKRLGPVLAYIAEKQKELDMSRSAKAPRRRGQRNHMFKVG